MANSTVFQQSSGPTAKRGRYEAVNSIGNPPHAVGEGAVGILSQTVIPSTTIRWILPARIRHQAHNDVIFVSQSFIQLREFLPSRHLADMSVRLNFDRRILAAKVLSYVDSTPFIDQVVKQENLEREHSILSLPPQILILALDLGEIAFVYAEDIAPDHIKFRVARKRLPADVSVLGQFGIHLTVDSKSCTVAISPSYGQLGILQLKTLSELCGEIAAFNPNKAEAFVPLKEQRFIQIDGLIVRMEFLLSPSNTPNKVVLALLVSRNEATYLCLYSWEEKSPLRMAKLESGGPQRLPPADRLPLLMIPSNKNASFTLVTESGLTIYNDVLSPNIRPIHIDVPQTFPPNFTGSCRSPLWVQWAKPWRHPGYLRANDDFFLVREDGELEYLQIRHEDPTKLNARSTVGRLNIGVDSAFAILEGPSNQGGDICIVGGDMMDGVVCHMRARESLDQFQSILNLAPIRDLLIVGTENREDEAKRMYICSGKGDGHGTVAELRYGLEARIGFCAEHEEASAATGVWAMPQAMYAEPTFLISYPMQTSALRIDEDRLAVEFADDELANAGMQMNSPTLAFAATKENILIQITIEGVAVLSPLTKKSPAYRKHRKSPVLVATIQPDMMLFATATMDDDGFRVLLHAIEVDDSGLRVNDHCDYLLADEPSGILIVEACGMHLLLISTVAGKIHVLKVNQSQGLHLLSSSSITALFPGLKTSAIGCLAPLAGADSGPLLLMCGTRDGWLLVLGLAETGEGGRVRVSPEKNVSPPHVITLKPEWSRQIGQTSLDIYPDSESRSAALLLCNCDVYRLTYSSSDWSASFRVSRIWMTDVIQPELQQPRISAVAPLYNHVSSGSSDLTATFFCLSKGELLVSSLSLRPNVVPRRMMLAGDPYQIAHVKNVDKLVVAITETQLVADSGAQRPARRVVRPGIQFLDPDCESKLAYKKVVLLGQAGSRITSLLSWTTTNGTRSLDLIAVGLYIDVPDAAHCDGRIIYMTAVKNGEAGGKIGVEIERTASFIGSPIYSLAILGHSSIVVSAGSDLFIQSLDLFIGKWVCGARYALPSPAISLHVSGRFVYATTARHALKVFEVEDGTLILRAEQTQTQEAIVDVTQFVGSDLGGLLATSGNKGGAVLGLSKQRQGDYLRIFDARLPLTVNCLRESYQGDSITDSGKGYYGSTLDGSLYKFTTLGLREWELLNFINRVAWKTPTRRPKASRKGLITPSKEQKKIRPSDMHINGDRIIDLLRSGPSELRRLLSEPSDQSLRDGESSLTGQLLQELSALSEPVFGASSDPVLSTFRWMEQLVRHTW